MWHYLYPFLRRCCTKPLKTCQLCFGSLLGSQSLLEARGCYELRSGAHPGTDVKSSLHCRAFLKKASCTHLVKQVSVFYFSAWIAEVRLNNFWQNWGSNSSVYCSRLQELYRLQLCLWNVFCHRGAPKITLLIHVKPSHFPANRASKQEEHTRKKWLLPFAAQCLVRHRASAWESWKKRIAEQLSIIEHPMYKLKQELNGENTVCDHVISKRIIIPQHKEAKLSYGYII